MDIETIKEHLEMAYAHTKTVRRELHLVKPEIKRHAEITSMLCGILDRIYQIEMELGYGRDYKDDA